MVRRIYREKAPAEGKIDRGAIYSLPAVGFEECADNCAMSAVKSLLRVRREKGAGRLRVKVPPGNWVAPPGSNQSGGGGNEAVGASGVEGHIGDLASMQAVT